MIGTKRKHINNGIAENTMPTRSKSSNDLLHAWPQNLVQARNLRLQWRQGSIDVQLQGRLH